MNTNGRRYRNAQAMTQKVCRYIQEAKKPWKVTTTEGLNVAIDFEDHVKISEIMTIKKVLNANDDQLFIVGHEDRTEKSRVAILNPIF